MSAFGVPSGAFIAVDTTGLPGKIPGWEPKVIGFGIAFVVDDAVAYHTGSLVYQPPEIVNDERCYGAFKANGLSRESIYRPENPREDAVAAQLRQALGGRPLRGFGVKFLSGVLAAAPWNLTAWGDCVMEEAAPWAKALRSGKAARYCSLPAALTWAADLGYDVAAPPEVMLRSEANAVRVAKLTVALRQQAVAPR